MSEETIPPFQTSFSEAEISETLAATEDILRSGRLTLGLYTEKLEGVVAEATNTNQAIAVNSGSTALEIIYRSLDVEGRQVLVPSNTNFATAAAAVYAGAKVELYDNGLYPNEDDFAERLNEDTAAAVVVHIGGYVSPNIQRIADRCEELGVPLIEDAAHAHGALQNSKAAGSFGHAGAFSFFPTKNITTGEGGMIVTSDEGLAAATRQYRDQGKGADNATHEVWGNSWRMTEIGAALGLAQMKRLEEDTEARTRIINRYMLELAGTALEFPDLAPGSRPSGHKCIAILPENISRIELKDALLSRGVQLGRGVYEAPLHKQPLFKDFGENGDYKAADSFASRHVCLPLWRLMEDTKVSKVIDSLQSELS